MRSRGFTLLELLVVMMVIAVLTAIAVPAVFAIRRKSEAKRIKTYLELVKTALESYANDFGDYPPSAAKAIGLPSNGVNEGNECLVRCLTTKSKSGPYMTFEDGQLANDDGDSTRGKNPTSSAINAPELFELKDSWGNPYVYVHNRDYETSHTYLVGEGNQEKLRFQALKSAKTKEFHGLRSFQLLSLGPDGKLDEVQGEGDDILVWGGN